MQHVHMKQTTLVALLALAMLSTGCATLSRSRGDSHGSLDELEYALAATKGAPYAGDHPTLAALFTGLATENAELLRTSGLGDLAGVFEICPDTPTKVHLWPTPSGLMVRVKRSCAYETPGNIFGTGMAFDERAHLTFIDGLPFPEDPDIGRTHAQLSERYAGTFTYPETSGVPVEFREHLVSLLASDNTAMHALSVRVERNEDGSLEYGYSQKYDATISGSRSALDRGLDAFGTLVERYAGNGDGVVTPWEVERFDTRMPYYLAIAHGLVRGNELDLLAEAGFRSDKAALLQLAVVSLRTIVGEDTVVAY